VNSKDGTFTRQGNVSMNQRQTNRDTPEFDWTPALKVASNAWFDEPLDDGQIEMLAAYAEGRLVDDESTACEDLLCRNPAAMRLFEELSQFAEAATVHRASPATLVSQRDRRSVFWWGLQTACAIIGIAGLTLAFLANRQSQQMQTQVAALEERWAETQLQLGVSHKERLLKESSTPVGGYWTGTTTPEMLLVVRSRGVGQPTPAALAQAEQARQAFAPLHDAEGFTGRAALELASVEIVAGRLDTARERLDEARKLLGDVADVENVQAVWLLAKGDQASVDEAEGRLQSLVRVHPDFVPGWFNLALLLQQKFRDDESKAAWQEYLKRELRPDYRQAALRHLEQLGH
jgi:tetratricopeptide (TPR) repeat protein